MPDVRLIDANALVKTIESVHCKDCDSYNGAMCRACEWMDAMDYIEDAPTIDAQPVKHGRFVFEKGDYRNTVDGYRCTSCGETYHTKVPYFSEYKFCPNCGAKMGGDADADS